MEYRFRIVKESKQLPTTVQNLKSVENNTPWNDYEFDCPVCGRELKISSSFLNLQDDHDAQWLGDCPQCNAPIEVFQPD